jgi:hypothetical protein
MTGRRSAEAQNLSHSIAECGHPLVTYHDTDVGFLCLPPLHVFLKEDKGPDHHVLAASRIGGHGRVDTGRMERQRETEPSVTES